MFSLVKIRDVVRIKPDKFNIKLAEAVRDELNRKLANKVLLNVGLCIALKDITSIGNSILLPGDGASHTGVTFRYIVFRPPVGHVLTGKIRSCSREGVHITLGFFDDILIPPASLQFPSRFEEAEQAWVWEYPLPNGEKHDLFMDIGEPIKFRVAREMFEESSPIGGDSRDDGNPSTSAAVIGEVRSPYRIFAAINESGLGVLSWWDQQNQHMAEDEEDEEDYDETEGACEE